MPRAFDGRPAQAVRRPSAAVLVPGEAVQAARRLNRASGMIAGSVLLDSAVEHYRGQFHNKAMYAPLISSALSLLARIHGHAGKRAAPHRARDAVYAASSLVGLIGTGRAPLQY